MLINLIDLVSVDLEGNLVINDSAFDSLTETFKADRLGAAYSKGELKKVIEKYIKTTKAAYPEAEFLGLVGAQLDTDGQVVRDNGEAPILGVYTVFSIPDPRNPTKKITVVGPYANTLGNEGNRILGNKVNRNNSPALSVEDITVFVHGLIEGTYAAAAKKYGDGDVLVTIFYPPRKEYTPTPKDGFPPLATLQANTSRNLTTVSFTNQPPEYTTVIKSFNADISETEVKRTDQALALIEKLTTTTDIWGNREDPKISPKEFLATIIHLVGNSDVVSAVANDEKAITIFQGPTTVFLRIDLGIHPEFPSDDGYKLNDPVQRDKQIVDTYTLIIKYLETPDGQKDLQEYLAVKEEQDRKTAEVTNLLLTPQAVASR